ncbi:MAG: 16S rRNA (adenine(1518)-N(6)/adenine(1519)-N(6))-dimethyltransferase RsmA [Lachnospiraceae bacterium]|nr:16S rRNA (adenine(1518)-N(6)/adenine(1519)-N(6))-dimethyltransferase RsmA [Lachnospiraceae bacterium]
MSDRRSPGGLSDVRSHLDAHGLSPNKHFGQNFLTDEGILTQIVDAAEISDADTVLEIGPGTGALTRRLAEKAGRLVAVEIDRGLAALLSEEFAEEPRVEILCADILKTDLYRLFSGELSAARSSGRPSAAVKVVANLPYYITTPILLSLLPETDLFSRFVVMMQREVADRMQASPGSKDYGALTLAVQYYADPRIVTLVPPSAFYPQPDVTSAVLLLERPDTPPVAIDDPDRMFALIRAAFGKRRKTLTNAIAGAPQLGISPEAVKKALAEAGLDPAVRGETLSLADFATLTALL